MNKKRRLTIKRFHPAKQHRLNLLADKNTEGELAEKERAELERLVAEAGRLTLENTRNLVRAEYPDLFDAKGKPIQRRVMRAIRAKSRSTRSTTFS